MYVNTKQINHIIIIPGLGNNIRQLEWISNSWKNYGIIPHVFDAKWKKEENGFDEKFNQALNLVDILIDSKQNVSLIGNSAGSSFVINLFGGKKKTNT
jgi:hypothetical protein